LRYLLLLAVLLAVVVVHPAVGQTSSNDLDAKLKTVDAKIQELERLKTDLEALKGQVQPAAPAKKNWSDWVKINGYFHNRYYLRHDGLSEFMLRRMYINLIVTPNSRTTAVVTWARIGYEPAWMSPSGPAKLEQTTVNWAMAFVDYKLDKDEWVVRFGQGPNQFGLECGQSSSQRIALERAVMVEGGGDRPFGMYFNGPWDRGLWITRNGRGAVPTVIGGVINGQFRASEKNPGKTFTLDLKWKPKWGECGASFLAGKWTNDLGLVGTPAVPMPAKGNREAELAYVRVAPKGSRVAFQSEFMNGFLFSNPVRGWYAQLEYTPWKPNATFFAKYENYDPNRDTDDSFWHAWIGGFVYQLDSSNKITVQFQDGKNTLLAAPLRQELGVQWQFGF